MEREKIRELAAAAGFSYIQQGELAEVIRRFYAIVTAEQQSWIASLEQNARDADRMYKELETELAASQAHIKVLREALENCRLFAARRRRADEWATHILRLCESGGSVANPLRQDDSALREMLAAERELCILELHRNADKPIDEIVSAIRAMEDQ